MPDDGHPFPYRRGCHRHPRTPPAKLAISSRSTGTMLTDDRNRRPLHQWVLPTVVEVQPLKEIDLPLPLAIHAAAAGFSITAMFLICWNRQRCRTSKRPLPRPEPGCQRICKACRDAEASGGLRRLRRRWHDQHSPVAAGISAVGAEASAAIPSRMDEGYGLNPAMVDRLAWRWHPASGDR